ncbi:DUF3108 domain-containing protein [Nafulsella turpanensis]|uniref:DUF3108 domain-containing protein n=1 Tax=Nafulsella turpanensis TaxID=1265690 RepID=UPI000346CA1E|nr:DUF3108 domain-containing protein [Nafulsella turpanensis]
MSTRQFYPSFILLIILVLRIPAHGQDSTYLQPVSFNPVQPGETMEYKVTFGFLTVGKAQIKTAPNVYKVNGRPCYKIDVRGKTSGAVDWVANVDDTWGSYIDTLGFYPYLSYRNISENSYRKNEVTKFDQRNKMVELKVLNQKTGKFREPKIFQTLEPVRDIVGGYTYLRTLDYAEKKEGDTLSVYGVFEDEVYRLNILFAGREVVKTKLGPINAIKLVPVMPDNKLFAGENSITIWLSDDLNKIPVKVEAELVIGKAACEIISHERLKNPPHYQ